VITINSPGISKGAFYLFYGSKEALFLETLSAIQNKLYDLIESILLKEQNKGRRIRPCFYI
jgi:AcrR family transcriptional regulator